MIGLVYSTGSVSCAGCFLQQMSVFRFLFRERQYRTSISPEAGGKRISQDVPSSAFYIDAYILVIRFCFLV